MDGHDARPEPRPAPLATLTVDAAHRQGARRRRGSRRSRRQLRTRRSIAIARASPKIARLAVALQHARHDRRRGRGSAALHACTSTRAATDEIAQAVVDDTTGRVVPGLDRPAGRLDDGPRLRRRVRATHQRPVDLARAVRRVPGRARRLAPAALVRTSTCSCCSRSRSRSPYFNQGLVFWSVPLAYPPLRLPARAGSLCIGAAQRAAAGVRRQPAALGAGRRGGLPDRVPRRARTRYDSNVIDVGYAGVDRGRPADRGDMPYGNFPTRDRRRLRDPATPTAPRRPTARPQRRQPLRDARTSSATPTGRSTTPPTCRRSRSSAGPACGTTCRPRTLTSVVFDALCALGLLFAGRRLGGWRLGVALAFAWAAYPFTAFALESNSNDMIVTAFADLGLRLGDVAGRTRRPALAGLLDEVRTARARARCGCATRGDPRPELAEWAYGEDPGPPPRRRARASACAGPSGWGRARHAARRWAGSSSARFPRRSCSCRRQLDTRPRVLGRHVRLAAQPAVAVLALGLGRSTPACPTCAGSRPCCRSRWRSGRSRACACRGGSTPCGSRRSPARS